MSFAGQCYSCVPKYSSNLKAVGALGATVAVGDSPYFKSNPSFVKFYFPMPRHFL